MDEYLAKMKKGKETFRGTLIEFLKLCDPNDLETIYCFVEAPVDKTFYNTKIRGILNKSPITFTCKGKSNVILLFKEIEGRYDYSTVRKGFFVDKDFDNNPSIAGIYVTPYYSVENYFVQENTVKVIIEDVFRMQISDSDFEIAMKYYRNLQADFHKKILLLNVFLCCQNYLFKEEDDIQLNTDTRLKKVIKNIVLENLVGVDNFNEIDSKEKIELLFDVQPIDEHLWNIKTEYFNSGVYSQLFRGKFEVRFLESFLNRLRESIIKADKAIWQNPHKRPLQLRFEDLFDTLPSKVIMPVCLKNYIMNLAA